jgi:hypothetical protein
MRPVNKHSNKNPYHESIDPWCVGCEEAYQITCMKDYQNLYKYVYPNDDYIDYKEDFYDDYNNMLNAIDINIRKNPNITIDEVKDAMEKGQAIENFLDTCIQMRLNQHKYCVRRDDQIEEQIHLIKQNFLEGDKGHKGFIDKIRKLKQKGSVINSKASNHPKGKGIKIKLSKRYKNSMSKSNRTPKTKELVRKKKNSKNEY